MSDVAREKRRIANIGIDQKRHQHQDQRIEPGMRAAGFPQGSESEHGIENARGWQLASTAASSPLIEYSILLNKSHCILM